MELEIYSGLIPPNRAKPTIPDQKPKIKEVPLIPHPIDIPISPRPSPVPTPVEQPVEIPRIPVPA